MFGILRFCSLFNGDLALSVTMTAISTVISMGMLPFNVFVYSKLAYDGDVLDSLDWNALGISLAVVISAISLGVLISAKCKSPTLSKYSNTVSCIELKTFFIHFKSHIVLFITALFFDLADQHIAK